jgi:hypothetical protein
VAQFSNMFRFLCLSLIIGFVLLPASAQEDSDDDCPKQIEYMNRNFIDPSTISLRGVEGRAIDSNGAAIPYICVALFTEKENRFVAQTAANENGYFRFGKIPKGRYRLVARVDYDYLCPVNVRIRRVSFPFGGFFRKSRLVLYMHPPGIDTCSYGDTK